VRELLGLTSTAPSSARRGIGTSRTGNRPRRRACPPTMARPERAAGAGACRRKARNLRKIDRVPPDALPWLYGVARKILANERRKRARVSPSEVRLFAEPEPVGDGVLAAAFNRLSEMDREVLRLVAWDGLSLADAATVLGCSGVSCRVRYHRAKSRLASRLEAADSFSPKPKEVTR
jgi:predicted DNA-binding protein (UPF0251 family)